MTPVTGKPSLSLLAKKSPLHARSATSRAGTAAKKSLNLFGSEEEVGAYEVPYISLTARNRLREKGCFRVQA